MTTIAAMTAVLLTDTVSVSSHHDLDALAAEEGLVAAEGREGDRGGDRDGGQRRRERPEPGGEELRHGRTREPVADARADASQREIVRRVAQGCRVAAQPLEELFVVT